MPEMRVFCIFWMLFGGLSWLRHWPYQRNGWHTRSEDPIDGLRALTAPASDGQIANAMTVQ